MAPSIDLMSDRDAEQAWAVASGAPVGPCRTSVVRSQARLFGARVPMRGWADHHRVLVEGGGGRRWYVDPIFEDVGLGWDLRRAVEGIDARR